jgi:predicted phosphodiesterase
MLLITKYLSPLSLFVAVFLGSSKGADDALTFFGWSDQHVKTDGNVSRLMPFVKAMNTMPGASYPASVGGKVPEPSFVIGAGDVTEWPTNAAMRAYDGVLDNQLKWKAYDVLGNHDDGGRAFSPTMLNWSKKRHGGLSYVFEAKGVKFIALWSKFDPRGKPFQPLSKEALDYLRQQLAKTPEGQPVVLFTHLCHDAMTNRDALVEAVGKANVILVLGGHYHYSSVNKYRGLTFVQLPSPKSKFTEFTVLRITSDRLLAMPYDFVKKEWVEGARKVLNVAIRGPKKTTKP